METTIIIFSETKNHLTAIKLAKIADHDDAQRQLAQVARTVNLPLESLSYIAVEDVEVLINEVF